MSAMVMITMIIDDDDNDDDDVIDYVLTMYWLNRFVAIKRIAPEFQTRRSFHRGSSLKSR